MTGAPALLWADCEADGLGPDAKLLEIGLRVTDTDLATIVERSWILPYGEIEAGYMREDADQIVRDMHDASGLWVECAVPGLDPLSALDRRYDIRDEVTAWVTEHGKGLPIAGSSCRVDRDWLTGWIPELDTTLHYRMGDVSSIKVLCSPWLAEKYPEVLASKPAALGRHRVMPDLDDSIAEALWFRRMFGL